MPIPIQLSLACLCAALTLPFLMAHHFAPIATFYQEWTAATFAFLAAFVLARREFMYGIEIPAIGLLPLGLIAILLLQQVLGVPASLPRALLVSLYLLWSLLIMTIACNLRRFITQKQIAVTAAFAILAGACLSMISQAMQMARLGLDSGLIFSSVRSIGNLAQANHQANYLWLGIVSAIFLHVERRLSASFLAGIIAILATASSLTGSRSALLYATLIPIFSLWAARRSQSPEFKRFSIISASTLGFMLLTQWGLTHSGITDTLATPVSGERILAEIHGTSQRLLLWKTGLAIFADHPWLGAGIGQFPYNAYMLLGHINDGTYLSGGEHAHNIFIQLACELGFSVLVMLLILGWKWWQGLITAPWTSTHWWMVAVLLILGVHSQLEYPLWYTFFLGISALALGLGCKDVFRPHISRIGTWAFRLILLLGSTTLASLFFDYNQLEHTLNPDSGTKDASNASVRSRTDELERLYRGSLFADYVPLAYAHLLEIDREVLADKIAICEMAIRFSPTNVVAYKLPWLLALNDKRDEASRALQRAVATHPDFVPKAEEDLQLLVAKYPEMLWLQHELQKLAHANAELRNKR